MFSASDFKIFGPRVLTCTIVGPLLSLKNIPFVRVFFVGSHSSLFGLLLHFFSYGSASLPGRNGPGHALLQIADLLNVMLSVIRGGRCKRLALKNVILTVVLMHKESYPETSFSEEVYLYDRVVQGRLWALWGPRAH